jgi:hypothetical protein
MGKRGRERVEKFHCPEVFLRELGLVYQELGKPTQLVPLVVPVKDECRS